MRLLGLADACRTAGLQVVEHKGWQDRGYAFPAKPSVVLAHHTATAARAVGDLPTERLLISGRSDLPGPLCQIALSRSGVVHVIAAGKANHAGPGRWVGVTSSSATIGIEAEHPGGTTPWLPHQLAAYDRLCAALLRYLGQPASRLCGHKEWATPAGRKVDPNYDMNAQRARVAALLANPQEDDVALSEDDKKWLVRYVGEIVWDYRYTHGVITSDQPARVILADTLGAARQAAGGADLVAEAVKAAAAEQGLDVDTDKLAASIVLKLGAKAGQ